MVGANRARIGDGVVAFDGRGLEWDATVAEASKRRAVLRIERERRFERPRAEVALAQALPKGKLLESIVRRATELGARRAHPIVTERTLSRPNDEREGTKSEKWRQAAIEGAKQSGNPFLPEIEPIRSFAAFLEIAAPQYALKLIASLRPGARSIKAQLGRFRSETGGPPASVVWLVGPEGDFSPAEIDAALAAGFLPVTLGPYVLRCETAAVAALAIIGSELEP